MEKDRIEQYSIGLRNSQVEKIEKYLTGNKRFRSISHFFQDIIDKFFEGEARSLKKDAIIFIIYPIVIMSLMLYVAVTTQNLSEFLFEESGIFYGNLETQNRIFYILGFTSLSATIIGMYYFAHKMRKVYGIKREKKKGKHK